MDIGNTFVTNNSANSYTLIAVQDGQDKSTASLVYHNNLLNNRTIRSILLNVDSYSRTVAQIAISPYGPEVSAHVVCTIASPDAPAVVLNVRVTYNYVPSTVNIYDGLTAFTGRNAVLKASLYWAEASLINYWSDLATQYLQYCESLSNSSTPKAALYSNASRSGVQDTLSFRFFETNCRIGLADAAGVFGGSLYANFKPNDVADLLSLLPFYAAANALAKSFHSTVITDLGQTAYKPNIFADAQLLEFFSSNFTCINETAYNFKSSGMPVQPYASLKTTTGKLEVRPSVISSRYTLSSSPPQINGKFHHLDSGCRSSPPSGTLGRYHLDSDQNC